MSLSLVMVPLVIALSVTVKETAIKQLKTHREGFILKSMQTVFSDCKLLVKTLKEHGMPVTVISDNCVRVKSGKHELLYERSNSSEVFLVSASGWDNEEKLLSDITCLEKEYKSNVQSYTYNKLLQNLSESTMTIESETVLEDNSILLTISA